MGLRSFLPAYRAQQGTVACTWESFQNIPSKAVFCVLLIMKAKKEAHAP